MSENEKYDFNKLSLSDRIRITGRLFKEIENKSGCMYTLVDFREYLTSDVIDLIPEEIKEEYSEVTETYIEQMEKIIKKVSELPINDV
ncbi:hypothetical protein AB3331_09355 [Streptococcus sp. H49]|uniref:hypothetical protein n=1 Tax=Streptococcus huangxiaojuni TaxID=3237239 RepID=UPI0034A56766